MKPGRMELCSEIVGPVVKRSRAGGNIPRQAGPKADGIEPKRKGLRGDGEKPSVRKSGINSKEPMTFIP